MKTKLIRSALLSLAALGTLALVSCQATSAAPTSTVACSKCGTVTEHNCKSCGGPLKHCKSH